VRSIKAIFICLGLYFLLLNKIFPETSLKSIIINYSRNYCVLTHHRLIQQILTNGGRASVKQPHCCRSGFYGMSQFKIHQDHQCAMKLPTNSHLDLFD
jgi:hypothetical protein